MRSAPLLAFSALLIACGQGMPASDPTATSQEDTATGAALHVADIGTGLGMIFLPASGDDATIIDAGSMDGVERGAARFLAYLQTVAPNLKTIKHLILSHPHMDHLSETFDLFDHYKVENVWDSAAINPQCNYYTFVKRVRDAGAVYHVSPNATELKTAKSCNGGIMAGDTFKVASRQKIELDKEIAIDDGATMTFLRADATVTGASWDYNNNSLVIRMVVGTTTLLLPGDEGCSRGKKSPAIPPKEGSPEKYLIDTYGDRLKADVLIVPHHGSTTSSSVVFLEKVAPKWAIISSGPTQYAPGEVLPDQEVVDAVQAQLDKDHGTLLRTDWTDKYQLGVRKDKTTRACEDVPEGKKVGPAGGPGGCDNVVIAFKRNHSLKSVDYSNPVAE